jgi:deoxycytidine triphosphate deaminase
MKRLLTRIKSFFWDLFGAVLSDRVIMRYNAKGLLIEQPISAAQLQPNSVDLTLGITWKKLKPNAIVKIDLPCIDPKRPIEFYEGTFPKHLNSNDPHRCCDRCSQCKLETCHHPQYYLLEPGEFVLMASNEIMNIPNGLMAFAQGRSSLARLAIQTEQAGLIDTGFRGTITFEVTNQSDYPIILYPGMRVAQVWFIKAQRALVPYGVEKASKYNDQIEAMQSKLHLDVEFKEER